MKRIITMILFGLLMVCHTSFAADFWKENPMWIDFSNPWLRVAKTVVIYPMEAADSDIAIDSYALNMARSGMMNWNWSSAAMLGLDSSEGRSVEELAAEVTGKADLFIVSQVVNQGYEHNYSPRLRLPVEMHDRCETEFKGNTRVDYDYYYTEYRTVPEQESTIYHGYFTHMIYDTTGALVAVYSDFNISRQSRRNLYEYNAEYFFKKVLPVMVKMSVNDKSGRR